jgi:SulP family sulfate permease
LAIETGMILASFIFMKRMSESTEISNAKNYLLNENGGDKLFEEELPNLPKDTMMYEINGPLFFAASQKFQEILMDLKQEPKVLILRMRSVPFIDATGITRLKEFCQNISQGGTTVIISGANNTIKEELIRAKFHPEIIHQKNVLGSISEAILRAEELLKES